MMIGSVDKSKIVGLLYSAITRSNRYPVFVGEEVFIKEGIELRNVTEKHQMCINFKDLCAN